jgi:glycosidase
MKKIIIAISLLLVMAITIVFVISNSEVTVRKTSKDFKENVSVCYEIFPIAYRDGNNDGIGDIQGITDSLEYLANDLQIDCVWITPIHPSYSYHKYDVIDYRAIDEDFGTIEDFEQMTEKAEELGIRVVMDFVINHTSTSHEWFQGWKARDEKYLDYYSWATQEEYNALTDKGGWHKYDDRYYFGSFWDQMPELNYENQEVREEIYDIARYWMDLGVDGFRIDAAKHIYDTREFPELDTLNENVEFFIEFNDVIKRKNKNSFMIGEVWTTSDISKRFLEGMDSVFNFEFGTALINSINSMDSWSINSNIRYNYENLRTYRSDAIISNFLSNHDQNRALSQFYGDKDKMVQAAANYLMQPGISWIYYGEEIGMTGFKPDERIREPFKWVDEGAPNSEWIDTFANKSTSLETQRTESDSYFAIYKQLINIRQNSDVIKQGDIEFIEFNKNTFAFKRSLDGEEIIVISNFLQRDNTIEFDLSDYEIIFSNKEVSSNGSEVTFPANTTIIIGSKH